MITEFGASPDQRLAEAWPTVRAALLGQLTRRGTPLPEAEDVVQEVAARLLVARPEFTGASDLLPWASTVARRVAINEHRAASRRQVVSLEDEVGDAAAAGATLEETVAGRLRVQEVLAAARQLSVTERNALVSPEGVAEDRRAQVRLAVQRHRARAHLVRLVGGAGAAVLGWLRSLRPRRVVSLAAVIGVVLLSALLALPRGDTPRATEQLVVAPRSAPPASPVMSSSSAGERAASSLLAPAPRGEERPLLRSRAPVPALIPGWRPGRLEAREREPAEPVFCLRVPALPALCTP